jgi:hypothetical protein
MEFGLAIGLITAAGFGGFYWGLRVGRKDGYIAGEHSAHMMYVNLPGLGRAIDMKLEQK